MRNLIRFISKKKYANQFLSGKIYMNSMSFFWSKGFEEQKDFFEGLSSTIPKNKMDGLPQDFKEVLCYDIGIRVDAYKYCNICSFYRLDADDILKTIQLPSPEIDKFGDYAVIILDEDGFINRINKAINKNLGWYFLCGDVNYHRRLDTTKPNNPVRHTMDLMLHEPIDINLISDKPESLRSRDCFDKINKYSYQNEWRICLYRNIQTEAPYTLEIGDISDIACIVKTKELRQKLIKVYKGYWPANVSEQRKPYQGNISRKSFRNTILKVDGKVWIMATIG